MMSKMVTLPAFVGGTLCPYGLLVIERTTVKHFLYKQNRIVSPRLVSENARVRVRVRVRVGVRVRVRV